MLQNIQKRGIITANIERDIYKFVYPNRKVIVKNLGEFNGDLYNGKIISYDSTVFDLRTIDTTRYSDKYHLWKEIDLAEGDMKALVIGDVNKNNHPEIYGYNKSYSDYDPSPARIFESDSSYSFKNVFQYGDTVEYAQGIYDVDCDGREELFMRAGGPSTGQMYKANATNGLPTELALWYYRKEFTYYDPTPGDFDKNGKTDLVYGEDGLYVHIKEYNSDTHQFDSVYTMGKLERYVAGYSFGDYDKDGKTEIVFGSSHGDVYVIEAQNIGTYQQVWKGSVATYNAYLHFSTNDIDSNGKMEFWIGGDAYYSGLGMTRFTCFEMNGDNSYTPVARVDLVGIFSFFAGNCFAKDIDHDGKEELFICIDQNVIILKFTGSPNHHSYELFYIKQNELAENNSVYLGATLYNIMDDARDELFISLDHVNNKGRKEFSYIYRPDFLTKIKINSISLPMEHTIFQNYPNPFNSITNIEFQIPSNGRESDVKLRIFNALGKEIRLLLNGKLSGGKYHMKWDGKDNNRKEVESGVYFISIETQGWRNAVKSIMIK